MKNQMQELEDEAEKTKQAIAEKFGRVENKFREAIEDVKTNVRDSLDIKRKVRENPLTFVGGSLLTGFVVGTAIHQKKERPTNGSKPSFWQKVQSEFEEEIEMIKAMAMGAGLRFLERKAQKASPPVAPYVQRVLENINRRYGDDSLPPAHPGDESPRYSRP